MYLPLGLIKDLGLWWVCLSIVTESRVLQGPWVSLNPPEPLCREDREGACLLLCLSLGIRGRVLNSGH